MRLILFALILTLFPREPAFANQCARVFSPAPPFVALSAEQVESRGHDLARRIQDKWAATEHFAELEVGLFFRDEFAGLNQRIDSMTDAIHAQRHGPVQQKTDLLRSLNDKAFGQIQQAEKILSGVKGWFESAEMVKAKLNLLLKEMAVCRGQGAACSTQLIKNLDPIKVFHRELFDFTRAVAQDLAVLGQARAVLENGRDPQVAIKQLAIVDRFAERLRTIVILMKNQVALHEDLIARSQSVLETFDHELMNLLRALVINDKQHLLRPNSLDFVHRGGVDLFTPEMASLSEGDTVYANYRGWEDGPNGSRVYVSHEYEGRIGTFKGFNSQGLAIVDFRSASKSAFRKRDTLGKAVRDVVDVQYLARHGCYPGGCSGDAVQFPPSERQKIAGKKGTLVGYLPATNEWIVDVSRPDYAKEWATVPRGTVEQYRTKD